jgi:hypothetical protein
LLMDCMAPTVFRRTRPSRSQLLKINLDIRHELSSPQHKSNRDLTPVTTEGARS